MKRKSSLNVFFFTVFIAVIIDFITKNIVDNMMVYSQKVLLLPNILSFEKVYNTGAAFSILQKNTILLSLISVATIAAILYYILKNKGTITLPESVGFGFVAGGALGNLADRIFIGHVIDFIQVEFISFPIFNFADIFINIGVIILLFSILFNKNDR